jgi:hypothetical protein
MKNTDQVKSPKTDRHSSTSEATQAERDALRKAKPGTQDVADLDHGHDDGLLDSIGKAITAPVRDAAAEDDV